MLRSFRVANHKSIRDEHELSLVPAYDKARQALTTAAIFGANASGKSNLLHALLWMATAVRQSYATWEPGTGVPRQPFLLSPAVEQEPSLYCVELILSGVRYTYGFTVDNERVLEEWLYVYPLNRKRILFERDGDAWTFGTTVSRSRAEAIRELTRPNTLFLSLSARSELKEVAPVYRWFQQYQLERAGARLRPSIGAIADRLRRSEADRDTVISLVQAADLGIRDIQVRSYEQPSLFALDDLIHDEEQDIHDEEGTAAHRIRQSRGRGTGKIRGASESSLTRPIEVGVALLFQHGESLLSLADQSEGTVAWLRVSVAALRALEQGTVLAIDEIDASLHPRLTVRLIELFRSEDVNRNGAQLLFSTHDATLLGTSFGDEILARDEIWFVEKDPDGATSLFPLTDFHPRKEENTERRYLGGSYGAVPAVFSDTLVERLRNRDNGVLFVEA